MEETLTEEAFEAAFLADKPFVNCHTHIFTGDHVPPFLAKSYLPFPFYILLPVNVIVAIFRFCNKVATVKYLPITKRLLRVRTVIAQILIWLGLVSTAAGFWLTLLAITYTNHIIAHFSPKLALSWITKLQEWMERWHLYFRLSRLSWEVLVVLLSCLVFPSVRNMLLSVARLSWKFIASLPGKSALDLAKRYLAIGKYAFHTTQGGTFRQLRRQYPDNSRLVVLPMDMEYMSAGQPRKRYRDQMQELADLKASKSCKDCLLPFIFVDARRCVSLAEEKSSQQEDKIFFDYVWENDTIVLKDCFIKDFIEVHGFIGFKIYPALGYYPFDPRLLPLWKYAAEKEIPILTHCIRGTIFYRGNKEWDWNRHPVFMQSMERIDEDTEPINLAPLDLPQMKNVDFSYNFTHPMNYLCLLEEPLLRKVIAKELEKQTDSDLKNIFGYTDQHTVLARDLRTLKICLAHFGGDDEWAKYYEKDRYYFSNELMQDPDKGLNFFCNKKGEPKKGKIEQIWKSADWYSIICSMMLQYDNVYADISYILHDTAAIQPLLKQTLENVKLRKKVLYGTDFFVVRNHKTDKNMLTEYEEGLSQADFTVIAKINPRKFLYNKIHGALFKDE